MTVRETYEIQAWNPVTYDFSYARLENATPTATQPAKVTSAVAGTEITGTVLSIDAKRSQAVIDVGKGQVYSHKVRNVKTYNAGAENTFAVLAEGDVVYYDGSATMPADVFLSTSPLDNTGANNPIFGNVVHGMGVETALAATLPTTTATAATETVAVMQK